MSTGPESPAEAGASRRVLVLAPFSPRLDAHHGGSRAIAQLLHALADRHRLAVVYLRGFEEPPLDPTVAARCEVVREVPHLHPVGFRGLARRARIGLGTLAGTPSWVGWWRVHELGLRAREVAALWQPDVIQLEFHLMGQYLSYLEDCPSPRILVHHDPSSGTMAELAPRRGVRRLVDRLDRVAWPRYESDVLRKVDAVVVFTERDREATTARAGSTRVVTIPLGTRIPDRPADPAGADPASLLFVGSMAHPPNVDAVHRLVQHILPAVRAERPAAHLMLVGSRFPPEMLRGGDSAVHVWEAVPDVGPYFERAAVVVVPVRLGGGMRVKILEAMAAGKAIVASRLAIAGLPVADGRECCLAETDGEFARQIVKLLDDEGLRRRLGTQARAWAAANLSWSRTVAGYERLYASLPERRGRPGPT